MRVRYSKPVTVDGTRRIALPKELCLLAGVQPNDKVTIQVIETNTKNGIVNKLLYTQFIMINVFYKILAEL